MRARKSFIFIKGLSYFQNGENCSRDLHEGSFGFLKLYNLQWKEITDPLAHAGHRRRCSHWLRFV